MNHLVVAKWKGYLKVEEVKDGCGFMSQLFKENLITIHLSEHRDLRVLSQDVQEYLVKEWFPEIEKIGVRKVGAVVSYDVFAEATVRKVNSEGSAGKLVIELFSSDEECICWLLE
jgi:hypothetical protein